MESGAGNYWQPRTVQYLAFAAVFSLLNFIGLGLLVAAFPDFFNIENSFSVFIRDFSAILLAPIIVYLLSAKKIAKHLNSKSIYSGIFLCLIILFSPLWPVLALMFYPDQHFCLPNCPQVPFIFRLVLNTVGLFWGLTDASEWGMYVLFSFQMVAALIATLFWIIGLIRLVQWRVTKQ